MERNDGSNTGSAVIWLVSGLAIGAAAALLLAPQKGERTRRQLAEQAERGKKTLVESGREIYERGRELYERGREIAEDAADLFERTRNIAEKNIKDRT